MPTRTLVTGKGLAYIQKRLQNQNNILRKEQQCKSKSELLAIFVPGPNEYHAMPDMETATDMVARHNTF